MRKKILFDDKERTNIRKKEQAIELLENWLQKLNAQEKITKHK